MENLKTGRWAVLSVVVDSQPVLNFEGFIRLEITEYELAIQPIGLRFWIEEISPGHAILETNGHRYLAVFDVLEDSLCLTLTRPDSSETVVISAQFDRRAAVA